MLLTVILLLCAGCSGDAQGDVSKPTDAPSSGDSTGPTPTSVTGDTGIERGLQVLEALVVAPTNARQRLSMIVVLRTNEPTTASLVLSDGATTRDVVFPAVGVEHRLPVLGLPPGTHDVEYIVEAVDGSELGGRVSVTIEPVDDLVLPQVDITGDPGATEPGYTLMGMWTDRHGRLAAYDATGALAWLVDLPGVPKAASLADHGRAGVLVDRIASVRDVSGDLPTTYGPEWGASVVVRDLFHHELLLQPDGSFWSLETESRQVDEFPVDPSDLTVYAPATIGDDLVVHYAADGTLLGEWSMVDLLDSRRVGFNSYDEGPEGLDWGHANALALLDDGDRFVVSVRHQDALVAVDAKKNAVDWILANPDGWSPALEALRLQPVGEVSWPYHSHGAKIVGDMIYVFDNGNERRTTPYSDDPEPGSLYSRLVAYRIDPAARTVEQAWEIVDADRMFSRAMGNAQPLAVTGHVLGTYPYQNGFDGITNRDAGRGEYATRILELDPADGSQVWAMTLWSVYEDASKGWLVDRAMRIPSLYTGIATETVRTTTDGG